MDKNDIDFDHDAVLIIVAYSDRGPERYCADLDDDKLKEALLAIIGKARELAEFHGIDLRTRQ